SAAAMPDVVVYAGAVVAGIFVAAIRPAQTSVLPSLTRDVPALTAANVVVGWAESVGIVIAGGLVGVALATGGPTWVFGVSVAVRRLAPVVLAAALLFGAGLALTASADRTFVAAALVMVVGGGRTMYDVAVRSLLQRAVPAHLVARVFGIAEAVTMLALAVG